MSLAGAASELGSEVLSDNAERALEMKEPPLGEDSDGVEGAVEQVLSSSVAKALLRTEDPSLRDRAAVILRAQFAALSVDGDVNFPAAVWLVSARV